MEAYESSTVRVWQIQYVYTFMKINHTVGPTVQYLYVVQLYTYTYSTYLWTEIGYSIIRSYQIFEGTKVLSYESTKVLSKVLSKVRKCSPTKVRFSVSEENLDVHV